jgi:hypothetical protein
MIPRGPLENTGLMRAVVGVIREGELVNQGGAH